MSPIMFGLFCASLLFSGCSNSFDTRDTTLNSSVELESTEFGISENDTMLKESIDEPENIKSENAIFDIEWYNIRFTVADDWIKLDAVATHGIPTKLLVDNGTPYANEQLSMICVAAGTLSGGNGYRS